MDEKIKLLQKARRLAVLFAFSSLIDVRRIEEF